MPEYIDRTKTRGWIRFDPEDQTTWPPIDEHVLATFKGFETVNVIWLEKKTLWPFEKRDTAFQWADDYEWANDDLGIVVAWMPLPELYKNKEEEL